MLLSAWCVFFVFFTSPAFASNWQANLYGIGLPSHVVAVDKARQLFFLYEKKGAPALKFRYPCATGQVEGDKQVINDLRTPEGIYFVDYKISSGLDFKEYGGIAYTLNYPNPVDKLRGKTGHGIWIHSKGFGIVPRDTRGCIAIDLQNIGEAGPLLRPGTPVVVAEHFPTENVPKKDDQVAKLLRRRMDQWTRAWAARSTKMFDFYNEQAYSQAMPETFAAFKANKERLFKVFKWINIFNREVHVLQGPGYWVTWSEQFYRAPNLSTEGIRRLYWQPDTKGIYRIVGMEWLPRNLGMQAAYLKGQLVASTEVPAESSPEAPVPPPISMPETPEPQPKPSVTIASLPPSGDLPAAVTSGDAGNTGAASHGMGTITPTPQPDPDVAPASSMRDKFLAQKDQPKQLLSSQQTTEQQPKAESPKEAPKVESPTAEQPKDEKAKLVLDAPTKAALQQGMQQWADNLRTKSKTFYDVYNEDVYGTLDALPKERFAAHKQAMQIWQKAPWVEILQKPVQLGIENNAFTSRAVQWLYAPNVAPQQGTRTLYWQYDTKGKLRIVASKWTAGEHGMKAAYLEGISTPITEVIEAWRKAWEAADVTVYMGFYTDDAVQQGRSAAGIRAQKKALWERSAPKKVQLTGLRLQIAPQGIRADMRQIYQNKAGTGDNGVKTLLLRPVDGTWRIFREDWSPTAQAPR